MPTIPDKPDKKELARRALQGENVGPKMDLSENSLPLISESRCKVCQSKFRINVDMMLARGFSVRSIADSLTDAGEEISYKSVERHSKAHLDLENKVFKRMLEKHADEYEKGMAEAEIRIVSGKAFLEVFIQKAFDQLLIDDIKIDYRDAVRAVELRETLMKDGYAVLEETMMNQVRSIILAIKEICDVDTQEKISARAKEIAQGKAMLNALEKPHEVVDMESEVEYQPVRQRDNSDQTRNGSGSVEILGEATDSSDVLGDGPGDNS